MKLLNSIFNFSGESSESKDHFEDDVYTSIEDLPIWNWNKLIEKRDLTFLYKKEGAYTDRLIPVWDEIQQQHLDEFGYSEDMKSRERIMLKIIKLNIKFVETRDRVLLNFIKVQLKKLEAKNLTGSIKFGKLLIIVSKAMGFRIDPKKFTTYEWYHTLNSLGNGSSTG